MSSLFFIYKNENLVLYLLYNILKLLEIEIFLISRLLHVIVNQAQLLNDRIDECRRKVESE